MTRKLTKTEMKTRNGKIRHPGDLIHCLLVAWEMKHNDLAQKMGVDKGLVSGLLRGQRGISCLIAQRLERVFGVPAEVFSVMQAMYDTRQHRKGQVVRRKLD